MVVAKKLARLRTIITENLRVQRDGQPIEYINAGNALQDACAKQNHTIFARRGCGKTLLLHQSSRALAGTDVRTVYLNCEDFKRHSFPNVLIEILLALFRELERNLNGWFGKKKKSRIIIQGIVQQLVELQRTADVQDEEIKRKQASESGRQLDAEVGAKHDQFNLKFGAKNENKSKDEVERSFKIHREKLQDLAAPSKS